MGSRKEITCQKSKLFKGARELIQRSEKTTPELLDWIEGQIDSGCILLFKVFEGDEFIGIFTGCVEREQGKPCNLLIIHAVSIQPQETPFICTLYPVIHELVKTSGLKSLTVRSQRAGMDRRLEQHGFERVETIYRRSV